MKFQAATQIVLVLLAIVMVVFVIKPKLADISNLQAQSQSYIQAIDKATQYNNKLSSLLNKAKSMPTADKAALDAYIPGDIDVLQVSQDIESIVKDSDMILSNVEAGETTEAVTSSVDNSGVTDPNVLAGPGTDPLGAVAPSFGGLLDEAKRELIAQQFKVTALGTYDQFKAALMNMERNHYPLRVVELSFDKSEDSDLTEYTFTLETYAMNKEAAQSSDNTNQP